MTKVNINFQIELDDKELEKMGLTAEQYAESLIIYTNYDEDEKPEFVVCQDVDNKKYGDKIAYNIYPRYLKRLNAKAITPSV